MAIVPSIRLRRDVKTFGRQLTIRAREEVRQMPGRWFKYAWRLWLRRVKTVIQVGGGILLWAWLTSIIVAGTIAVVTGIIRRNDPAAAADALLGIGILSSVVGAFWLPILLAMGYPGYSTRAMPYFPIDLERELRRSTQVMALAWSLFILAAPLITLYIMATACTYGTELRMIDLDVIVRGTCLGLLNSLLIMVPAIVFQRYYVRMVKPILVILGFFAAGLLILFALRPLGVIPADPPTDPKLMMAYMMATTVDPAVLVRWLWWTPIGITHLSLQLTAAGEVAWGYGILAYPLAVLGFCGGATCWMNLKRLMQDLWFYETDRRTGDPAAQAAITAETVKSRLRSGGLEDFPDARRGGWFGLLVRKFFSRRDQAVINLLFQGRSAWRLRWYLSLGILVLGFSGIFFPQAILTSTPAAPLILLVMALAIASAIFLPTSTGKPGLTLNKHVARRTPAFSHYPVDLTVMCRLLHRLFAIRCLIWLVVILVYGLITHLLFGKQIHAYTLVFVAVKLAWFLFWASPIVVISSIRGASTDPEFLPFRTVLVHWPMTLCALCAYLTALVMLLMVGSNDFDAQLLINGLGFLAVPVVSTLTFFAFRWYYNRFLDLSVNYRGQLPGGQRGIMGRR